MSTPQHTITQSDWDAFLNGQWQKEQPTQPGKYQTSTRDGLTGPEVFIMADGRVVASGTDEWCGWWWSAPTPRMPKPMAW